MTTFAYRAYDAQGRRVEGRIDAGNGAEAADLLRQRGLLAYRTRPVSGSRFSLKDALKRSQVRSLRLAEYASFARQLSTVLQADVPLDQALRLVAAEAGKSPLGTFAEGLATSVTAGRSLSSTIDEVAPDAPRFMSALIRAGEARGKLGPCLTDLAAILDRAIEVRGRLGGALVYPCILLFVSLLVVGIVVGVLVPTLMPIFKDSGAPPPYMLQLADALGQGLANYWPVILAGIAALAAAFAAAMRRPTVQSRVARAMLALPVAGPLVKKLNVAVIARTLGSLLRNGVPLVQALPLTASVASNREFRQALLQSAQTVKEGARVATAFKQSGVFPELALRFVAIGEEASRLDEMLIHLADVEDTQSRRMIETLFNLMTPALTLLIGGMVGGLILSVMQAVLSVNEIAL